MTDPAPAADDAGARLRDQLGFYFSDANLRRDRFLQQHVGPKGTGEVEISVLASFNRVKELTEGAADTTTPVVRRAARCGVSDDGLRVCRRARLPTKDDSEARTVYVERLPAGAASRP